MDVKLSTEYMFTTADPPAEKQMSPPPSPSASSARPFSLTPRCPLDHNPFQGEGGRGGEGAIGTHLRLLS